MTSDQTQVILGTLLGNSELISSKEGISLLMKSNNLGWLLCKANELNNFQGQIYQSRGNFYWRSLPLDELLDFYNLCYSDDEKYVTLDWLDKLKDIAIAVWYSDVGCLVGRNKRNACLRIQQFVNCSDSILQFFNEVDVPCKINQVRNRPVIVFTLKGTKQLINIVKPYIIKNKISLIPKYIV